MMKRKKKVTVKNPVLHTWTGLNDFLRDADEAACRKLLKEELRGRRRQMFLKRIHSRLNKVRADAERLELLK